MSFRILPHLRTPERLIAELCRVANRSVVVDYPSVRSVNVVSERLFALKSRVEADTTRPFTVFSPAAIRRAFDRNGFRVVGARPQFLAPMALHRLLRSPLASRAIEAPGALLGITRLLGSPVIVRADRR
jgi:hypothetical protein